MELLSLLKDKRSKIVLSIIFVGLILILLSPISFVGSESDKDEIPEISYKDFHSEQYQKIETDYITFELPKIATHYWNVKGLDTYEIIISNFSIKNNSDYVLKFTWQDERYITENFQIHYNFKNNKLIKEDISYNSLSKYEKSCMNKLDNPLSIYSKDDCLKAKDTSKLTFTNMTIEFGTLEGYNYKNEYNLTCVKEKELIGEDITGCLMKVAYPVYSWSDFSKITTSNIKKDFSAIDDVGVSACGTLNIADTRYYLTTNIEGVSGTCFIIDENNIILDFANHNISGDGNGWGVLVNEKNGTIIKNGLIYDFESGIKIDNCVGVNIFGMVINKSSSVGIQSQTGATFGTYDHIIQNNTIQDTLGYAIVTTRNRNVSIENNIIIQNLLGIHSSLGSANITIKNNTIYDNTYDGIIIEKNVEVIIKDNKIYENRDGIHHLDSSVGYGLDNLIDSNTIYNNSRYGINLINFYGSTVSSNNISNNSFDFYITGKNDTYFNNIILNNYINDGFNLYYNYSINNFNYNTSTTSNAGAVMCIKCFNISISNLNLSHKNIAGIYLYHTNYSYITNITLNNNKYGIYLSNSTYNYINDTKLLDGNNINIFMHNSSHNNIFTNCNLSLLKDVSLFDDSSKNIFLNTTYNGSKENVGTGAELIRKWYYRAYVNDSINGNALEGMNITAYNVSNTYQFNLTTDITGYTPKTEIIDYVNLGGTKNYYSLYTIYAGNETYPYSSHTYNVTLIKNNLKDVFSLKIDLIAPNVTIIYPLNKTYPTSSIDFNLTVVDNKEVDTCFYTLNSGIKNYTMSNPSGSSYNATNSSIVDGGYLANFYCNDTYSNLNNSESVSFSIDTTSPAINITSPSNTTYDHNANIALKYTVSDSGVGVQSCWYSTNNGITNNSISCGTNVTLDAIQGSNTWLIGVNDSVGNQNYSTITFNVGALTEAIGTWTYYYPKLDYQTKWFNSLTITSKLNYDYNASLNISTDTLAVNESIIVRHQDGTNLSYNFTRNDNGMVNWTGLVYGYVSGTSNTTYFNIWYNNTKVNLTYVNYTITEVGHQYQIYNITITANSTREIKDVYVYFNFSDTDVLSNILYNCTIGGICNVDISNYEDVTWSDVDGDGAYDLVEWFVDSITNNRTYQLKNSAGSPVEVTQEISILNPPVKPFDNIEWENTITMYNPNSFSATKVFKLELPFGAFDITLDDISKNLQYDPYGILQPYILIIDKNDPSHTESVYLSPGETKTFKVKYKTSSVTVYSSTYFPTYFEVDKKALIVNVLRVKNQADDVVSNIEYRIPIDYAEDLTVCEGEYKDGCPEEDDANYENVTLDTTEEVDGEYKLEISNISANAAKMITLSYYIPTVKLVSTEIGRRSILGNLTTFKKYEFQSIAPFKLSDVRYRESGISCDEVVAIKECDWRGICEKNLVFECPLRLKLGSIDPGDSKNVYLWYLPKEEVKIPPKGTGWIAKFWNWGKPFILKKGSILWYVFGWLGTENEAGDKVVYSGRIIIFLIGMLIIIGGIIFITIRKGKFK